MQYVFNKQIELLSLTFLLLVGEAQALECGYGTEPVLRIEYEAEDHAACQDPTLAGLPSGATWGINTSTLYQTKSKHKRVTKGKCVAPVGLKAGRTVYRNLDFYQITITTKDRIYWIDMEQKIGSVSHRINDNVFEVGPVSYTADEYAGFEKMEVLPGYTCSVLPQLPFEPSNMKICAADIGGMRVVLYENNYGFVSDHLNWYKAKSIEWSCEKPSIFDPPSGIDWVNHY